MMRKRGLTSYFLHMAKKEYIIAAPLGSLMGGEYFSSEKETTCIKSINLTIRRTGFPNTERLILTRPIFPNRV
ncbi:hypothetical protein [Sphingobacterium sp. DR205]|uniref:hypothetical protein n=1 Tax=Sphingobacterium sp. DR205 TaxID=2713573 RepID=UPI0013E522AD|nr:hypothetical protein [Sphingobacterium sp. DR205]QIH34876.1 hypothetical protein G6053_19105 [Sphingobacterium sp. DR205]